MLNFKGDHYFFFNVKGPLLYFIVNNEFFNCKGGSLHFKGFSPVFLRGRGFSGWGFLWRFSAVEYLYLSLPGVDSDVLFDLMLLSEVFLAI